MVSPYLLSQPAPQRNGSNTTSFNKVFSLIPTLQNTYPISFILFCAFHPFLIPEQPRCLPPPHGRPLQAEPGAAACAGTGQILAVSICSGNWDQDRLLLITWTGGSPSPDDQQLKAAVWRPAKSKGLEHTLCHTSHVILVTSGPGALIPQLWNGDISPPQRHSDLMTQYIPSALQSRDTAHWSLPLSHNRLWKGHLHLSFCSQPQ